MPGASGSWELPLKPEGLEETPSIPQLLDYLSPGLGRAIANYQARTTGAPFYAGQPTAAPNVPKPEEAAWMLQPSSAPLAAAITKEELKRLFSHPEVAPAIEDLVRYWPTQYLDPLKVTTPKLPALRAKAGSSSAAGVYYPHLREMEVSPVGREVMGLWKEGISPKRQIETFKHEGGHYAEDFIQNPAEMKQIVARMKDIGLNVDDHIMDWWRSTGYATDWKVAAASEHFARKFEQLSPNEIEHVLDPIFTRLKQSVKKPSFAEWRATNPLSGAIKKKSEEELIPRIERQKVELPEELIKRFLQEQKGSELLNNLSEKNITPKMVSNEFWEKTYWDLPAEVQQRFQKYLKNLTGHEPGSALYRDRQGNVIRAKDWIDVAKEGWEVPNSVEALENIERGYIALMDEANRRFGKHLNILPQTIAKLKTEELIPRIERQLAEAKTKGDKYYIKKFEDQLRRAKKGAETGQWESELGGFAPDVTGIMVP